MRISPLPERFYAALFINSHVYHSQVQSCEGASATIFLCQQTAFITVLNFCDSTCILCVTHTLWLTLLKFRDSSILCMTHPTCLSSLSVFFFLPMALYPNAAMASSFLMRLLDHTQRRTTVGTTPLDEWSTRRRDLYMTTHNTHNRQTPMPPRDSNPQPQQASGRTPTP